MEKKVRVLVTMDRSIYSLMKSKKVKISTTVNNLLRAVYSPSSEILRPGSIPGTHSSPAEIKSLRRW